tara:strand:+ start:551 stop:739 length:189 start_codon:yes stop_codon:yes gene_type:complete
MGKELMEKKSEDHPKKEKQSQSQKVEKRENDCWHSGTLVPILRYVNNKDNTTISWERINFYA